jgi:hypothetical protein
MAHEMEGHCYVVGYYLNKITSMLYLAVLCESIKSYVQGLPYSEMKLKESHLAVQSSSVSWVSCRGLRSLLEAR